VTRTAAALLALGAAALFGASAPLLKPLTHEMPPLILSGLLYLGAGVAALLTSLRRGVGLGRGDVPWLAGVVLFGGLVGPLLLLVGLARTSATASSLMLNLETVFTALIAVALFGERLGSRGLLALLLLVGGGAVITFERGGATRSWLGPLCVAGACFAWGIDNNLTQKLSHRDPLVVVRWKGLCAGALALALGLALGGKLPPMRVVGQAVAIGAVGYGVSLALYVRALRELGAARTGLLFATAPFAGAVIAIPLLGEHPGPSLALAAALMAAGVALLLTEKKRA
jgi:drug/metabolite transporter (DMT)-like permease